LEEGFKGKVQFARSINEVIEIEAKECGALKLTLRAPSHLL
jgi:hypothetical protein